MSISNGRYVDGALLLLTAEDEAEWGSGGGGERWLHYRNGRLGILAAVGPLVAVLDGMSVLSYPRLGGRQISDLTIAQEQFFADNIAQGYRKPMRGRIRAAHLRVFAFGSFLLVPEEHLLQSPWELLLFLRDGSTTNSLKVPWNKGAGQMTIYQHAPHHVVDIVQVADDGQNVKRSS